MAALVSRPIVLLGSMGAGKSTLGRMLAARAHRVFVDLDRRIERLFGRSIAALFERGEPHFRACEHAALSSLLAEPGFAGSGCVVATGGGIVEDPRNLAAIAVVGTSVYLRVGIDELVARLSSEPERAARPLLADRESLAAKLGELLARREAAYRGADICVEASDAPERVVAAIVAALAERQ